MEVYDSYPVLTNSPEETDFARALALEVFGREGVLESVSPMNASEDFAFMLRERPGSYFLLGNGEKGEKGGCMVHNPGYDFNDDIITIGATLFARLVENTVANLWRRTRMKKSLLLWLALMASTSALAEGERRSASALTRLSRRLNRKDPQGKVAGFDIDLGNAICQQLQAKCVWVESNFDGIIPALKARKFDAILSGMYMTEKRKAQIAFSDKLYNGPVFLVARKKYPARQYAGTAEGQNHRRGAGLGAGDVC